MLFTNPKNNVSRKMPTLAYRIEEAPLGGEIKPTRVVWEEIVDITADQAIAAATPSKAKDHSGPVTFLLNVLANGHPVSKKIIEERGAASGFSVDQIDRAKKKLGVVAFKEKGVINGQWFWAHPPIRSSPSC